MVLGEVEGVIVAASAVGGVDVVDMGIAEGVAVWAAVWATV